jgi:hypothetical protein
MTDQENKNYATMSFSDNKVFQLIATVYGPYAFGVVSLLIIWYMIVSPQLERQALDFKRNESVIENQREILASMATIVRSVEQTAQVLEQVTKNLDRARQ